MTLDDRYSSILSTALTEKRPTFLAGSGLSVTFETRVISVLPDGVCLLNTVPYTMIKQFKQSDAFSLQVGMTRFQSVKLRTDGEHLILGLNADSAIEETRQHERFTFQPTEAVTAEIINPFDQETTIVRPVMDMSKNGMSFRTHQSSELFKRGRYLPQITVKTGSEIYRTSRGSVVYSREVIDIRGHRRIQIGIKFED
jgi:hypothetical protein